MPLQRFGTGPLLDRFDLRVEVRPASPAVLLGGEPEESTETVAGRVAEARARADERGLTCNAELPAARLDEVAPLSDGAAALLRAELERGHLTGRGLRRVRTVADLQGLGPRIDADTVRAALALRPLPKTVLGVAA